MIAWAACSCTVFQSAYILSLLSVCDPHGFDFHHSMKLDKQVVQRRIDLMAAEGVVSSPFIIGSNVPSANTDL